MRVPFPALCLLCTISSGLAIVGRILEQIESTLNIDVPLAPSGVIYDGQVFDYIVVGAGAAGSAVAYRLAKSGASVLLVEAGGNPGLLTRVPGAAMGMLGSPEDWQYQSVPENSSCQGFRGNSCRFSRGKCLGGSTSINYMMYTRGNRLDYNLDIPGWTWEHLKPYFLKYEANHDLDKLPPSSKQYHNTTGIMDVQFFAKSENLWHERIVEGYKTLNFPYNNDVNGESQIGVSRIIGYVHDNERMSAARAYLARDKVQDLQLTIAKRTKAAKVIINDDNEAVGVEVLRGLLEVRLQVFARKEVILSAGTVGTVQILMLSGIGHKEHLKKFNIKVRSDLPVGDGLSEHIVPLLILKVDSGFGVNRPNPFTLAEKVVQGAEWALMASGEMASLGLTDITAFANHKCYDSGTHQLLSNSSECELPTAQFINAYIDRNLLSSVELIAQHSLNFKDYIMDQFVEANNDYALIVASPVLLRPKSRGRIRLASADPSDDPAIYPNFLTEKEDEDASLAMISIIEDLVATPIFQKHNASVLHLKLEGCPRVEEDWEGYWRCYAHHVTFSVFHATGTAQLGAVLDACLRVRRVSRLRVADLSMLPTLPRGNTAAAAIAIGERLADFILKGCDFADQS